MERLEWRVWYDGGRVDDALVLRDSGSASSTESCAGECLCPYCRPGGGAYCRPGMRARWGSGSGAAIEVGGTAAVEVPALDGRRWECECERDRERRCAGAGMGRVSALAYDERDSAAVESRSP